MKQLNEYIIEKFKINSKTAHKEDIEIKLDDKNTGFSKDEINTILEYAQSLKVIPTVLTNHDSKYHVLEYNLIYLYFTNDWDQINQKNYLMIRKDNNKYLGEVCSDYKLLFLKDKNDNLVIGDNVETVCKGFIKNLTDDFYNKLK